jgi:vacuolar-type H+-ATPase subunit E/Vma4
MKPSNAVSGERAKLKMPMPKLGDTGDQDETEPSKRSHPGSMPMVKIDAREDVENLFSGEDLSEEFKADAVTLFETALNARVMLEAERIREEVEAEYSKEIESFTNELTDRLDSYLEYAVESWMGENQLAIESTLRTELSTELVEALADVLREHYVTVPDGATDALDAMAGRVAELEGKLNETVNELVRTRSGNREAVKASIIEAAAEGLTLLSSEKLKTLVEQLEFDGDEEAFAKRVLLVKERFVDVKEVPHDTGLFSESFEGDPDDVAPTDPAMRAYVDSLGSLARE